MSLLPSKIGDNHPTNDTVDTFTADFAVLRDLAGWIIVNTRLTGRRPKPGKASQIWSQTRRATGINPDRILATWPDDTGRILAEWAAQ